MACVVCVLRIFTGHPFPAGDYEKAAQIKKDTDQMFLKHLSHIIKHISGMSSIETYRDIQGLTTTLLLPQFAKASGDQESG